MKTAIYLRISDKDYHPEKREYERDEFDESNSIDNQRLLIQDYIRLHDNISDDTVEYVDDGFTGTHFNRPAFQRMISDIKAGKIDTIIVKDLSRLGRDYIETGDYIEQIFPLLSVRVIAINSNYDSDNHKGDVAGIEVVISNFINAMYSRDLSRKRKTSDRARWAAGKSSVKNVPYGYVRKLRTTEWEIDEETGPVVEFIFKKAATGWTLRQIVNHLNDKGVLPPGLYKKVKNNYKIDFKVASHENIWDSDKVRTILQRKEYYGNLVVHKSESVEYMYFKPKQIPKEEQIELQDHHIPIISKELYDAAQTIFVSRKRNGYKSHDYSLKSKIHCGNCRLTFDYADLNGRQICYCGHKKIAGKYSSCTGKTFSYEMIEKKVFEMLENTLINMRHLESMMETVVETEVPELSEKLKQIETKVEILKSDRIRQYEAYSEGKLTSEIYLKQKAEITESINRCENEIDVLKNRVEDDMNLSYEVKSRNRFAGEVLHDSVLNKRMANHFIEKVYVHDMDRIELEYTFAGLLDRVIERNDEVIKKYQLKG